MFVRVMSTPARAAGCAAAVAFLVYLGTLAPSVTFIDSGELAAVACTLGIAHPTGYPLFTLLGRLFSILPIGAEEIFRLNLMSALFCSAGVFFFTLLVAAVLQVLAAGMAESGRRHGGAVAAAIPPVSAAAGLLLAGSETVWAAATAVEVYSLHVLFLALLLLLFLRAVLPQLRGGSGGETPGRGEASWMLFAFVLGLSFTNHMTTVLLAPGFIYLYAATQGIGAPARLRMLRMAVPFLAGLSVYLYLPVRASQSPLFAWGNPVTPERFLWHFTGKQYRVWIFSSFEAAGRQLEYFLATLPGEMAFAALLPALIGVIVLYRRHRKLAGASLLLFAACVLYAINYDIHDIDSYFLLAYFVVALWAGAGLFFAIIRLAGRTRRGVGIGITAALVLALVPFVYHFERSDQSRNRLVEDYTMNMLRPLPPGSLVFSFQWDYWVSASYYFQYVRGVRPDVAVVDKELLRRSWYFAELERRYPWLIAESRAEVDAFLRELYRFEHGLPYNPAAIQGRFVAMIASMMRRSMATRPVFVTQEIEREFTAGLQRVPEGLAFRLVEDTLFHLSPRPEFAYRPLGRRGRLEDGIKTLYAAAWTARGAYVYRAGEAGEAGFSFRKALEFDPAHGEALRLLRLTGVGGGN